MRATRAHRDNRRSHHALDDVRLSKCVDCGATHKRHTVCMTCGSYRGKKIIDMTAVAVKKAEKAKTREKDLAKS